MSNDNLKQNTVFGIILAVSNVCPVAFDRGQASEGKTVVALDVLQRPLGARS